MAAGKGLFAIYQCDPGTGQIPRIRAHYESGMTDTGVVSFLRDATGFNSVKMAPFAVMGEDGKYTSAERWLEDNPSAHVRAIWATATSAQREQLRKDWPDLGLALDNLEVNS